MAQLKRNQYIVLSVIGVILTVLVLSTFVAPFSYIKTDSPTDYKLSVDGEMFESSIRLKPGNYKIYVKTPFYIEQQYVKLGFFDNKTITVTEHVAEAGINHIAQKLMVSSGFPGTTVGECYSYAKYYYVCETTQLSSVRAAEIFYTDGSWKINLNPASAQSEKAQNEMIKINSSGSQR